MKTRPSGGGRNWPGYAVVALICLGAASTYMGYSDTMYLTDRVKGWFNRAQTAAFAEDMIAYVQEGQRLLPTSGNPVWLFPTERTDFALIQRDINSIIERARIIAMLPRGSEGYQVGMDDLRDKIHVLEDQVAEAAPYMFASPTSIALSTLWFVAQAFLVASYFRRARERTLSENMDET
jgi:hypothetical protein